MWLTQLPVRGQAVDTRRSDNAGELSRPFVKPPIRVLELALRSVQALQIRGAMRRTRRLVTTMITAVALMFAAAAFAYAPLASADPICGTPGTPPCAGPSPLTPEQQCAFIAWRSMMPCNWLGVQVPAGTPGSWDNPPAPPPAPPQP